MEDIARMADECMRDVDEDGDDGDLEDDEDLLVSVCVYSTRSSTRRQLNGQIYKKQLK